ncbi:hypothetical protein AVEN_78878-1 [Araneus ventricosus]|uniref:Uncharacterized protein n=1 Tax=Araneus ventricosus TaxID=182803 RepID=A0A4Y2FYT5_ARAVE|nr:hypothetical protein AVEN_78878-1 [Araneus ventricosus]
MRVSQFARPSPVLPSCMCGISSNCATGAGHFEVLCFAAPKPVVRARNRRESNVRVIDKGVKSVWSWNWLEKQIDGVYVREIIRKIVKAGISYCSICCKDLQYGKQGFAVLARHTKSSKHMPNVKARKDNFALPAEISTVTRIPRPLLPLIDRVANSEAYASELPGGKVPAIFSCS